MSENIQGPMGDQERDARQLALVDRIIGLEAENANLRMQLAQAQHRAGDDVRGSATWRVGSAMLAPARAVRRVIRGGRAQ